MKQHNGWSVPDSELHFLPTMFENFETNYQENTLKNGLGLTARRAVCIDVGANIGLFSVRFGRLFDQVYSFEPVPSNFDCLIENTRAMPNVTCHQVALGDAPGEIILSLPRKASNSGAFSAVDFVEMADKKLISHRCEVRTLDSFQICPDLIKVDIQGYESVFLRGAMETIRRCKPALILENVSDADMQPIFDMGYVESQPIEKVKHDRFFRFGG